ncbi:MAG: hypothetical protein LBT97_09070 [Planctomycetota bacterium]|nr:hypothetical protein [Planctomycetota bacterium]
MEYISGEKTVEIFELIKRDYGVKLSTMAEYCGYRRQFITDLRKGRQRFTRKLADKLLAASAGEPWSVRLDRLMTAAFAAAQVAVDNAGAEADSPFVEGDDTESALFGQMLQARSSQQRQPFSCSGGVSFNPASISLAYPSWISVEEIGIYKPMSGLMENRGGALIDVDRERLRKRMEAFFQPEGPDYLRWAADKDGLLDALRRRQKRVDPKKWMIWWLEAPHGFDEKRIVRFEYLPFDLRWCYYSDMPGLWADPKFRLAVMRFEGIKFLVFRKKPVTSTEGATVHYTSSLGDKNLLRDHSFFFPVNFDFIERSHNPLWSKRYFYQRSVNFGSVRTERGNLSDKMRDYLGRLGCAGSGNELSRIVWHHVLAICQAPPYQASCAIYLRKDWPRIPFPGFTSDANDDETIKRHRSLFLDSAGLGKILANLLDAYEPADGVTSGDMRRELAAVAKLNGARADIPDALALTAPWGKFQANRRYVQPRHGRLVVRDYTQAEREEIEAGAAELGLDSRDAYRVLGFDTRDVYLNDAVYWENVPAGVWEHVVGGHQVLKKWLAYRCAGILGRALTQKEAEYFSQTTRRIAAVRLLWPKLERNYTLIRQTCSPFTVDD